MLFYLSFSCIPLLAEQPTNNFLLNKRNNKNVAKIYYTCDHYSYEYYNDEIIDDN